MSGVDSYSRSSVFNGTVTSICEENCEEISPRKKKQRIGVLCRDCGSMKKEKGVVVHNKSCQQIKNQGNQFQCHCCGTVCSSGNILSVHRVLCRMPVKNLNSTKSFVCKCGKMFISKNGYKLHSTKCSLELPKMRGSKVPCICGKEYATTRGLSQHKRRCPIFINDKCKTNENNTSKKSVDSGPINSTNETVCALTKMPQPCLTNKSQQGDLLQKTYLNKNNGIRNKTKLSISTEKNNSNTNKVVDKKEIFSHSALKRAPTDISDVDILVASSVSLDTGCNNINKVATCTIKPIIDNFKPSVNIVATVKESSHLVHVDKSIVESSQIAEYNKNKLASANKTPQAKECSEIRGRKINDLHESDEEDRDCLIIDLSSQTISPDTPIKNIIKRNRFKSSNTLNDLTKWTCDMLEDSNKNFKTYVPEMESTNNSCKNRDNALTIPVCSNDSKEDLNKVSEIHKANLQSSLNSCKVKQIKMTDKCIEITSFENVEANVLEESDHIINDIDVSKISDVAHFSENPAKKNPVIEQTTIDNKELPCSSEILEGCPDDFHLNSLCSSAGNENLNTCKLPTHFSASPLVKRTHPRDSIEETLTVEDIEETPSISSIRYFPKSIADEGNTILVKTIDNNSEMPTKQLLTVHAVKYYSSKLSTTEFRRTYGKKYPKSHKLKRAQHTLSRNKVLSCFWCRFKVRRKNTLRNHVLHVHSDFIITMLDQD